MSPLPDPKEVRKNILKCSHKSGHGHIPTSFSIVEMVLSTYGFMNHDPQNPECPNRDLFILSKGHAALGYYCCLAELGYFDPRLVESFGGAGTIFGCHPDRVKQSWVEVSCGSLGHGIGVGVGMALSQKINKTDRQVYCLVGDGESNEGTVWEAVMVAVDQKLNNLQFSTTTTNHRLDVSRFVNLQIFLMHLVVMCTKLMVMMLKLQKAYLYPARKNQSV